MLAVLADTTVTGRDVSTVLASLAESGGHLYSNPRISLEAWSRGAGGSREGARGEAGVEKFASGFSTEGAGEM